MPQLKALSTVQTERNKKIVEVKPGEIFEETESAAKRLIDAKHAELATSEAIATADAAAAAAEAEAKGKAEADAKAKADADAKK